MRKRFSAALYIIIALALIFFGGQKAGLIGGGGSAGAPGELKTEVVRVVDGDTLVVNYEGHREKLRMIGVNTPESVASDESRNCPEGEMASEFTKSRLEGKTVYLEFDVERYDQYDRLLAYVYTEPDGEMFEETLLRKGYARTVKFKPNVKYYDRFMKLEEEARKSRTGFWVTGYSCWR